MPIETNIIGVWIIDLTSVDGVVAFVAFVTSYCETGYQVGGDILNHVDQELASNLKVGIQQILPDVED